MIVSPVVSFRQMTYRVLSIVPTPVCGRFNNKNTTEGLRKPLRNTSVGGNRLWAHVRGVKHKGVYARRHCCRMSPFVCRGSSRLPGRPKQIKYSWHKARGRGGDVLYRSYKRTYQTRVRAGVLFVMFCPFYAIAPYTVGGLLRCVPKELKYEL